MNPGRPARRKVRCHGTSIPRPSNINSIVVYFMIVVDEVLVAGKDSVKRGTSPADGAMGELLSWVTGKDSK
jgi:hypothetical protein